MKDTSLSNLKGNSPSSGVEELIKGHIPSDVGYAELFKFLLPFYPNEHEPIHFRTFAPKNAPKNDRRLAARKIVVTRRELATDQSLQEELSLINNTCGLYFVVNGGGETDSKIKHFNAWFAEDDSRSIEEQHRRLDSAPLQPSIRVVTRQSVHAYWLIKGGCAKADWRGIQHRLISHLDSDQKIKNPSRVMRLPFFNHITYSPESRTPSVKPVTVAEFEPERRYTLEEMAAAFPPVTKPPLTVTGNVGPTPPSVSRNTRGTGKFESWDELNAEAARRIRSLPLARVNNQGWTHAPGICHSSHEGGALYVSPSGAYGCLNACARLLVRAALGLPERPTVPAYATPIESLTDLGNARRLVRLHGSDLRFCHVWQKWLVWDGTRFRIDDTGETERRAKHTVRAIYNEAAQGADSKECKAIASHAMRSESHQRIQAMLALAKSEPGIPVRPEDLDRNPFLLNVLNGTLDLRTGDLFAHRHGDLITKVAPVAYDPEASCPTWDTFLSAVMKEQPGLINFLRRAIGYSLTGDTSERKLFILHGTGGNGKTTMSETCRTLLGDYAMRTPTETLLAKRGDTIPNDVARLKGVRFVTASETEEGRRLAESLVKDLTGGDTISARFMRSEWFEFRPECKLWLSTNHKPSVRGTDKGIWDRLRLIPFERRFTEKEQDKNLLAKLKLELPGILAWAVSGCLEWQKKGLDVPVEITEATNEYQSEMDVLGAFIEDCCERGAGREAQATALYNAYKAWCEAAGEKIVITQRAFGLSLRERGFDKSTNNMGVVWLGIAVKRVLKASTMF